MPQMALRELPGRKWRQMHDPPYQSVPTAFFTNSIICKVSAKLEEISSKQSRLCSSMRHELMAYTAPVIDVFRIALQDNPDISISNEVMGGAPCIANTRIPVWMILQAIEEHGTVEDAVRKSYPQITVEQAQSALRFSARVVECPLDYQTVTAPR